MTRRRWLVLLLAVLIGLPWICGGERKRLSDAERRRLPGAFAKLKDGRTCFELQGRAPAQAVVFVHGISSPSYIWGELPENLRQSGYMTLTYDLYGRGWSDRPWEDYDLDLFDRQLESLLRKVGIGPGVHLVGLSMGGIVASEFTLRHPEMVNTLTLIDPAGLAVEAPGALGVLKVPLLGDWLMQVFGDRFLVGGNAHAVHDKTRVGDLVRRFEPQLEYAGYKRAMLSTLRHMPLSDFTARYAELGRTATPIAVFWGRNDEVTPIEGARLAARLMPQAVVHEIDGAGHLPHYERVEEVSAPMLRFLARTPAPEQQNLKVGGVDADIEQGAPPAPCRECEVEPSAPRSGGYSRPRVGERREGEQP